MHKFVSTNYLQLVQLAIVVSRSFQLLNFYVSNSVTRFGDLLDFGPLFKAFGKN